MFLERKIILSEKLTRFFDTIDINTNNRQINQKKENNTKIISWGFKTLKKLNLKGFLTSSNTLPKPHC